MDEDRRDDVPLLIQARRFELVDEQGRVRAVMGDIGVGGEYVPALELRDVDGHGRSWLGLYADGPSLSFDVSGNDVLVLGVIEEEGLTDRHPDYDPTAHLSLADGDGQERWGVSVHHDGMVEMLPGATGREGTARNSRPEPQ